MPAEKKQGRRRLEVVAEPAWIDFVAEAAKADDRTVSSFIRTLVNEGMRRRGLPYEGETVRPRGRARKASKR